VTDIGGKGRHAMWPTRQCKRLKGKLVTTDGITEDENSPTYQESNDVNSTVMTVTTKITLVVVPPHLSHKEVMNNLSLPSWVTSSHTVSRIKTTVARHHQQFPHI
jgi:hypothetical protein